MVLRYSPFFWLLVLSLLVIGIIADWTWLADELTGRASMPSELHFLLMLCSIVGVGGILIGIQVIYISETLIESRHFLSHRVLEISSCFVRKYSSSGFVLSDASGQSIHVHKLMTGARDLHRWVSEHRMPPETRTSLDTGIKQSAEMRIVSYAAMIKQLFFLLGFVGLGVFMLLDKDRPHFDHVFGTCLLAVGIGGILLAVRRHRRR